MKQGVALAKAMQKKYRLDASKFDMISRLHAAAGGALKPNTSTTQLGKTLKDGVKIIPFPEA
jgi:hypothetical protein